MARATGVRCAKVDERRQPVPGTDFIIKADLVFLAIGFAGALKEGLIEQSGAATDKRGSLVADMETYRTSKDKVFAAGDVRRGQSLVVWAIREGRQAAHAIDRFLMGSTILPR